MARQTREPSAAARHARGSSASAGQARGLRALLQSLNPRVWGGVSYIRFRLELPWK